LVTFDVPVAEPAHQTFAVTATGTAQAINSGGDVNTLSSLPRRCVTNESGSFAGGN